MKRAVVVMGVAGCGKSTLGKALAEALKLPFHDADDYHPQSNIAKMQSGAPLTDEDRWPWLSTLAQLLQEPMVLACSALKASYRDKLSNGTDPAFIFLKISPETAERRLRARPGHFMPTSLVESQFATLEEPADAFTIDAERDLEHCIRQCLRELSTQHERTSWKTS